MLAELNKYSLTEELFREIRTDLMQDDRLCNGPKNIYLSTDERIQMLNMFCSSNEFISNRYYGGKPLFPPVGIVNVPQALPRELKENILLDYTKKYNLSKGRN